MENTEIYLIYTVFFFSWDVEMLKCSPLVNSKFRRSRQAIQNQPFSPSWTGLRWTCDKAGWEDGLLLHEKHWWGVNMGWDPTSYFFSFSLWSWEFFPITVAQFHNWKTWDLVTKKSSFMFPLFQASAGGQCSHCTESGNRSWASPTLLFCYDCSPSSGSSSAPSWSLAQKICHHMCELFLILLSLSFMQLTKSHQLCCLNGLGSFGFFWALLLHPDSSHSCHLLHVFLYSCVFSFPLSSDACPNSFLQLTGPSWYLPGPVLWCPPLSPASALTHHLCHSQFFEDAMAFLSCDFPIPTFPCQATLT